MKKIIFILLLFFVSCASKNLPPPEVKFEKNSILLHLNTDDKLNYVDDSAHTLYVVVYQLTDPNPFNQFAQDESGLIKLLEGEVFDRSASSVESLIIYPDTNETYSIDRSEGTRYVAIVTGYSIMAKDRIARLYEIPIRTKRKGFLWLKKERVPVDLGVELVLGSKQIKDDKVLVIKKKGVFPGQITAKRTRG